MLRRFTIVMSGLALLAGAGCRPDAVAPADQPGDLRATANTSLRGSAIFANVTIPEGVTVRLKGDVAIEATASVTIRGNLIGDCATVDIKARGSVTVTGTIRNVCSKASGLRKGVRIIGNGPLKLGPGRIESSGDVFISNDSTVRDTASLAKAVAVAELASANRPTLASSIVMCDLDGFASVANPVKAPNGVSGPRGTNGADGAEVFIFCFGDMSVEGTLIQTQDGGDGGAGVHDSPTFAQATGGKGGSGGHLFVGGVLGTTVVSGGGNTFTSGDGGNGGRADATGRPNPAPTQAASARAVGGDGGAPGRIGFGLRRTLDTQAGSLNVVVGKGGSGGPATAIAADGLDGALRNGVPQQGGDASAVGGNGASGLTGRVNEYFGQPGVNGTAGNGGSGGMALVDAGNGGFGSEQSPDGEDGGRIDAEGGEGGDGAATVMPARFVSNGAPGGDVTLFGGNGGMGASMCPPRPVGRGGNGGRGGDLFVEIGRNGVPGAGPTPAITVSGAANGGDGGDGSPPGEGGRAGINHVGRGRQAVITDSFDPGDRGDLCARLSFSVELSPSIASVNVGASFSFTCVVRDTRTGAIVPGLPLQWLTSNSAVATVATGIALGISPGTVTITCRLATGESATAQLTVVSVVPVDPLCNPQQTSQANVARQVISLLFPFLGTTGFCNAATLSIFTGPTMHPSATVPPQPRVMDHTSFNIVGGLPATTIDATAAAAFNQQYPCGTHATGRTLCPQTGTLAPGPYVVVFGVMNGDFPATDPTNIYQYGFVFDRDGLTSNNFIPAPAFPNDFFKGTDRWYILDGTPQQGWTLSAKTASGTIAAPSTTAARALMIGRTAILIVPASEFSVPSPDVRFTGFKHNGGFGQNGTPWSGDVQRPVGQVLYDLPVPDPPDINVINRARGAASR
ncbi:MAG: hypothetical protein ACRENP_10030 [Longimicrobiales bacterium]